MFLRKQGFFIVTQSCGPVFRARDLARVCDGFKSLFDHWLPNLSVIVPNSTPQRFANGVHLEVSFSGFGVDSVLPRLKGFLLVLVFFVISRSIGSKTNFDWLG